MAMIGIILTAHDELAGALLRAAELSMGPQPAVLAVPLAPHDGPETHAAALNTAVARVDGGAGVLILADLFGGTPANVAAHMLGRGNTVLLSGVNLVMVLEALSGRDDLALAELATAVLQAGREGIVDAGALLAAERPNRLPEDTP